MRLTSKSAARDHRMCIRGFAAWLLAALSLSAQAPLGSADKGVNLEKEAALGKQLAVEFRKRTTRIDNPFVQEYVDRLAQKLAAQMPGVRLPFTLSAIAEDPCSTTHEPVALPGGYVFISSGLFLAAQDEAEFAGMLAHAMGHIAQRPAPRSTVVSGASIPLIFVGGWSGSCSDGYTIPLAFVASQRSAESEADVLAVQTMSRAGVDAKALARYVERVQAPPFGTTSKAYSPAPARDERVAALLATIEKLPEVKYAVAPSDEFAVAQQEVRRLMEQPVRPQSSPSLARRVP